MLYGACLTIQAVNFFRTLSQVCTTDPFSTAPMLPMDDRDHIYDFSFRLVWPVVLHAGSSFPRCVISPEISLGIVLRYDGMRIHC